LSKKRNVTQAIDETDAVPIQKTSAAQSLVRKITQLKKADIVKQSAQPTAEEAATSTSNFKE
jgi:outer membrane lipopolysaccharide assembly protein LptE/RlpB